MFKHLKDTGFTYFSHWVEAMTYSLVLFIHAWLPDCYSTYVSDKIKERSKEKPCNCGKSAEEILIEHIEDQTKPFIEEVYSADVIIRHFNKDAPDHLYKWHAEIPQSIVPGKIIYIPKGLIHRLIKGTSELSISIKS